MNKGMLQLKKYIFLFLLIACFAIPAVAYAGEEKGSLQVVMKNSGIQVYLYPVAAADGTLLDSFSETKIAPKDMLAEKNSRTIAKILCAYAEKNHIKGIGRTTDSKGVVHYTNLEKGVYLVASDGEGRAEMQTFLVRIPMVINGTESYYLKAMPKVISPGGSSGSSGSSKEEPEEEKEEEKEEKEEEKEEKEEKEEEKKEEQLDEKEDGLEEEIQGAEGSVDSGDADIPGVDIGDGDIPQHLLGLYDPDVPQYVLGLYDPVIPQTGAVRYPIWLLNGFGAVCIIAGLFQLRKAAEEEANEEDMLDEEA